MPTESASPIELLHHNARFRRLWLADGASLFGDWFNTIALYTAVDALLGTAEAVGWVIIAKSLPVFLIGPFAGPLVDRLPRRNLMIAMDLIRAALAILLVAGWMLESVPMLYVCTAASMLCSGVFMPAKNASVPQLVEKHQLGAANAISGATWSVALAIGAALGGFATQWAGVTAAFVLDALSFLVSAGLLLRLPALAPATATASDRSEAGFMAGIRYFLRSRELIPLLLLKAGMTFTSGAVPLFTVYGNRVLAAQATPWIVGALFAARGTGAAIGSLCGRRILGETRTGLQTVAISGFAVLAVAYGWLSITESIVACMAAVLVGGVGNSLIWVSSTILLQREVPAKFHGRAFSLDFGLMTLTQASAILIVTGLVDSATLTPREAMGWCALAALPPGIALGVAIAATSRNRLVASRS